MRRLAMAAVALALVVGACSDDDGGDDDPAEIEEAAPADTTTTTAVADPTTVEAVPSAGCGAGAPAPAGETSETVTSGGTERAYFQHVPPAHDGETPVPVVVDYHGYSEGGSIHVLHTQLGPYGDEEGFVTISPDSGYDVPRWDTGLDSTDVAMFGDVLDQVEADLCVDTARIYVTGLSNGAMMTSALGCAYSDRIASIAPVAGLRDPEGCSTTRPVPLITFHGTEDTFIAFDGGLGSSVADLPAPDGSGTLGDEIDDTDATEGPSIPELATAWAERNGCQPELGSERVADDVELQSAVDCPAGGEVELYVVEGGGHTWPGSTLDQSIESIVGPVTMSISANELMWDFFQAHPLPA